MELASNSVLGETPKFLDLGLSNANTANKLNYVFSPTNIAGGFTENSNWRVYDHVIAEVTERRASKVQAYINYIKIISLKL